MIIVPLALIVSALATEQARDTMRQRAVPAASTIESRDRTVDLQASIGVAAGNPAGRRCGPAPATAAGSNPAGPGQDTAATALGRSRPPHGPGSPAEIADRFLFRGDRLQQADPFADPFPVADTAPRSTQPATFARRDIVAAVVPIATDQLAIRQKDDQQDWDWDRSKYERAGDPA